MASHRTTSTRSTAPSAVPATRPTRTPPAAPAAPAASQPGLKRALYARVSTEKQEREETVASQVDLLYQAAAAAGYDIAPTSVFIDEGVSGARLDRPALDRLRDLAAEGAFEVLLVTVPIASPAAMPIRCSWSRSSPAAAARWSLCSTAWGPVRKNRCCSKCKASLPSMSGR